MLTEFAVAMGKEPPPPLHPKVAWTEEELERRQDLAFEAELYTETFYWSAWRLRNVIKLLPGLSNFDVVSTRNARNHLVEHPEQNIRTTPARDLRFSRREGVTLLRGASEGERPKLEWVDAGLTTNAADFRDTMATALTRACERLVA